MTTVTKFYRYARPPKVAALGRALVVAVAIGLTGCVADGRPSAEELALRGYWYHDGNHQGGASGVTTQQAIYAATNGVWLWPLAENTRPGR